LERGGEGNGTTSLGLGWAWGRKKKKRGRFLGEVSREHKGPTGTTLSKKNKIKNQKGGGSGNYTSTSFAKKNAKN